MVFIGIFSQKQCLEWITNCTTRPPPALRKKGPIFAGIWHPWLFEHDWLKWEMQVRIPAVQTSQLEQQKESTLVLFYYEDCTSITFITLPAKQLHWIGPSGVGFTSLRCQLEIGLQCQASTGSPTIAWLLSPTNHSTYKKTAPLLLSLKGLPTQKVLHIRKLVLSRKLKASTRIDFVLCCC